MWNTLFLNDGRKDGERNEWENSDREKMKKKTKKKKKRASMLLLLLLGMS